MKNQQFNLIIVFGILSLFALACNFKIGDAGDNPNTQISRNEKPTDEPKKEVSKTDYDSPQKVGGYTYQRFDYAMYLIPKNLSEDELKKIAQNLHEQQPKTFLVFVDDKSKAEQYISYHKQADTKTPTVEFPLDWANEHIVASVIMFLEGERKWYLTKGYGYEKIAELE